MLRCASACVAVVDDRSTAFSKAPRASATRPRESAAHARWFQMNPSAFSSMEALIQSGSAASSSPSSRKARASLASGRGPETERPER
ncbi:MAG: hypothetical protein A2V88_06240 [Elusimicrobia bacterium RBG_16_66_12]|nr:MAG: hypothetical protein A2V88_06240 [Elusimicrobia bacterium RBG_16_66_12]